MCCDGTSVPLHRRLLFWRPSCQSHRVIAFAIKILLPLARSTHNYLQHILSHIVSSCHRLIVPSSRRVFFSYSYEFEFTTRSVFLRLLLDVRCDNDDFDPCTSSVTAFVSIEA